ncbi:hypothetical protein M758_7G076400 [Ceratodon purpureus]|nr:hypothetical protein M758_7G076400 [Ceratodon purpureus]
MQKLQDMQGGQFKELTILTTRAPRRMITCLIPALLIIASQMVINPAMAVPVPAARIPDNCLSEEHCCMPIPYTGKPVRQFTYDSTLPVRVRRAIHSLDDAYIAKLERGYELLRALPDSDPRSLSNQAKLHCLYCDNGIYYPDMSWPLEIHNGWLFLPWHRMFLYFHERILGKLLGDDTFAIPYWNWDNQETPYANTLPNIYAGNKSSSLWNQNRNACAQPPHVVNLNSVGGCTKKTSDELRTENTRLMYSQIVAGSPTSRLFFGHPYSYGDIGGEGPGTFEDNPHGTVHLWVGDPNAATAYDDMGNFGRSARDPIFYAHHANVDRIWTMWKTIPGAQRRDPTHPDFRDAQFTFYDENADLVIVNVSQIIDTDQLRYSYASSPAAWLTNGMKRGEENSVTLCNPTNPSQTRAMIFAARELTDTDVLGSTPLTFKVSRPEQSTRPTTPAEEVLEISGIKLDSTLQSHWEAYLFFPSADSTTAVSCPEFVGTFNFIPHVGQAQLARDRLWRVAFTTKLVALGKENSTEIVVTLVQFGPNIQNLKFSKASILWDTSPSD